MSPPRGLGRAAAGKARLQDGLWSVPAAGGLVNGGTVFMVWRAFLSLVFCVLGTGCLVQAGMGCGYTALRLRCLDSLPFA